MVVSWVTYSSLGVKLNPTSLLCKHPIHLDIYMVETGLSKLLNILSTNLSYLSRESYSCLGVAMNLSRFLHFHPSNMVSLMAM